MHSLENIGPTAPPTSQRGHIGLGVEGVVAVARSGGGIWLAAMSIRQGEASRSTQMDVTPGNLVSTQLDDQAPPRRTTLLWAPAKPATQNAMANTPSSGGKFLQSGFGRRAPLTRSWCRPSISGRASESLPPLNIRSRRLARRRTRGASARSGTGVRSIKLGLHEQYRVWADDVEQAGVVGWA